MNSNVEDNGHCGESTNARISREREQEIRERANAVEDVAERLRNTSEENRYVAEQVRETTLNEISNFMTEKQKTLSSETELKIAKDFVSDQQRRKAVKFRSKCGWSVKKVKDRSTLRVDISKFKLGRVVRFQLPTNMTPKELYEEFDDQFWVYVYAHVIGMSLDNGEIYITIKDFYGQESNRSVVELEIV